jgi:hypothetical protein
MAHIYEEVIVIKLSKLVKSIDGAQSITTSDTLSALEQVAQELVGDTVIVEIEVS